VSGAGATLGTLADRVGGRVIGDPAVAVARIAAVDDAGPDALAFAVDARFLKVALASRAAAVLTDTRLLGDRTAFAKPILAVANTRVALAALLAAFFETPRPRGPFVHPTAAVDPTASIGAEVWIGAHAVVGARSRIGDRSVLGAHAVVGEDATLGADALLHPRAYLGDRCTAGDRVILQSGAVIGSDGFGWAFDAGRLTKIPQVGIVELGADVEIGANSCVDRAQTGVTSIGEGSKIDNLCQIGHNCRIGKHTAIAALTGLAGTTVIGDYVQVGGRSGFRGHITVGDRVTVSGNAAVWDDVPSGATVSGQPAHDHREELRLQAYFRRLPKLFARVDALDGGPPKS
jgi:UDP-3-O-[3-hydroxymyristoyl] glucosamine N-acyltransferase